MSRPTLQNRGSQSFIRPLGLADAFDQPAKSVRREVRSIRRAERKLFKRGSKNKDYGLSQQDLQDEEKVIIAAYHGELGNLPPLQTSNVTIFLSSTFADFKEERNSLMKVAYPQLKKHCSSLGLEFKFCDMRWGVSEASSNDHEQYSLCMNAIEDCQKQSNGPNFLLFVGNRYGTVPLLPVLDADEFETVSSLAAKIFPNDVDLLTNWYVEDTNSVPRVYQLQTISSRIADYSDTPSPQARREWAQIESNLRSVFLRSVDTACELGSIPEERRDYYQMSVTALEARKALLGDPRSVHSSCAYFRELAGIRSEAGTNAAARFTDANSSATNKLLNKFKASISEAFGQDGHLSSFNLDWKNHPASGAQDAAGRAAMAKYLDELNCAVVRQVKTMMQKHSSSHFAVLMQEKPQIAEVLHHLHFCVEKNEVFCGRVKELEVLHQWIVNPRWQLPVILHGMSGYGKTALMAQLVLQASHWLGADSVVVVRFLGTSAPSSTTLGVLSSVCRQIAEVYKLTLEDEMLDSLHSVVVQLPRLIKAASARCGRSKPLLILLDAVDQLPPDEALLILEWLPHQLPPYISLVVSLTTESQDILALAEKLYRPALDDDDLETNQLELGFLETSCIGDIVDKCAITHRRKFTPDQKNLLVKKFTKCTVPLYMQVALAEALRWKSYDVIKEEELADDLKGIIDNLFDRLERRHGPLLVKYALGYLTLSVNGLSEVELEDLLSCNNEVVNEVFRFHDPPVEGVIRLPELLWYRLAADLKPYLTERLSDGKLTRFWYHRQFRRVCVSRYASGADSASLHADMAALYSTTAPVCRDITLKNQKRTLTIPDADRLVSLQPLVSSNHRKLRCLPFHLSRAGDLNSFKKEVACHLQFLQAYIAAFGSRACVQMMNDCLDFNVINDREILAIRDCLVYCRDIVKQQPDSLGIQLLGQLHGLHGKYLTELCKQCTLNDLDKEGQLQPVFACFPSSLGALKWYKEDVAAVYSISTDENRLLVLIHDHSGQRNQRSFCIINMLSVEIETTMHLPPCNSVDSDLVDAFFNKNASAVVVLLKEKVLFYDSATGGLLTEYRTHVGQKHHMNSCCDISANMKDLALGGVDKIGIIANKGFKQGLDSMSFEWDRLISVQFSQKICAVKFLPNEKRPILVSVNITEANMFFLKTFNYENKESLGTVGFPGVSTKGGAAPCTGKTLVALDGNRAFVGFQDASCFVVDVFSSTILWQHQQKVNPELFRTVRPTLKAVNLDRRYDKLLIVSSYGNHSWLRVVDWRNANTEFVQQTDREVTGGETIGGASFGETDEVIILGGRYGRMVAFDRSECKMSAVDEDLLDVTNPFRERYINREDDEEKEKEDENDVTGASILRALAKEKAAEMARRNWRPDEVWRPYFRAHERPMKFTFYRNGLVYSLGDDKILKAWRITEVDQDPRLVQTVCVQHGTEEVLLQHEPVTSFDVSCMGETVFTTGPRGLRQWVIKDGSFLRNIDITDDGEKMTKLKCIKAVCQDNFLLAEWKEYLILCDLKNCELLCRMDKPLHWKKSKHQDNIYCVTEHPASRGGFMLNQLHLPSLQPLRETLDITEPHPGIDETVLGISINDYDSYAVIHWGMRGGQWFEAWAIDLSQTKAKAHLLSCQNKTEKAQQRNWRTQPEIFKRMRCLTPLTSTTFLLGGLGECAVWDIPSQAAHLAHMPFLEAWLKHSLSMHLCDPAPARRSYDERSYQRLPVTAMVVSQDASLIVTGSQDGSIVLWRCSETAFIHEYQIETGWSCRTLVRDAHSAEITCLQLSADGTQLVSGSVDKAVAMLDVRTGQVLSKVFTHMTVRQLVFTPDCKHVVVTCRNNSEERIVILKITDNLLK